MALLESTIPGCDWLLGRLRELDGYLATPTAWVENHGFELARLMGFYVSDFTTDYRAALVLLASEVVTGETKDLAWAQWSAATDAEIEAREQAAIARGETPPGPDPIDDDDGEEDDDDALGPMTTRGWYPSMGRRGPKWRFVKNLADLFPVAPREIDSMHLDRLVPDDAQEARRRLALVIAEMIARIESIRSKRMRVAQAAAAAAAGGLLSESGQERELERRYSISHGRLLLRTIIELNKMRKDGNDVTPDQLDPEPDLASMPGSADPPAAEAPVSAVSLPAGALTAGAPPDTSPQCPRETAPHAGNLRPQISRAVPPLVAQLVTQSLCGDNTCETASFLRSKAKSSPLRSPSWAELGVSASQRNSSENTARTHQWAKKTTPLGFRKLTKILVRIEPGHFVSGRFLRSYVPGFLIPSDLSPPSGAAVKAPPRETPRPQPST